MSIHYLKYKNKNHGHGEKTTISIDNITCKYCLDKICSAIDEYTLKERERKEREQTRRGGSRK